MNVYLTLAVAVSVSCIYLGIIELKGKTQRSPRVLFFFMAISLAWFLFSAGIAITAPDLETVKMWYRLSAFGFSPFYAFNLHFYLSLLRKGRFKPMELVLYIPVPFVLFSSLFSDSLFNRFIHTGKTWRFFPAYDSPWFWVYFVYYISFTLWAVLLLFLRAKRSGRRLDRIQAITISIFIFISLILGSAADFMLTNLSGYTLPSLGPLILGVYIFGLWFAVMRYGFMETFPALVADEIIDNIHEMVFLLDPAFRVTQMNRWGRKLLYLDGTPPEECPAFAGLTAHSGMTGAVLGELRQKGGYTRINLEYQAPEKWISTDSYCTVIQNSLGDIDGYMIISRRNSYLERFTEEFGISRRERQVLINLLRGKSNTETAILLDIAERTVETHLSHVFNKTGTNSRIELFSLASRYGILSGNDIIVH